MTNEERYWKAEYENLRRKKNRELDTLRCQCARMSRLTYDLLKAMGMKEEDIDTYYRSMA